MIQVVSTEMHYNRDIYLSDNVFSSPSYLQPLVRPTFLFDVFERHDSAAKVAKARFIRFGVFSLIAGLVSLFGAAIDFVVLSISGEWNSLSTRILAFFAFASVFSAGFSRLKGHRALYCYHCYARERIRNWRFQLFLDGALVERFRENPSVATLELEERWAEFVHSVENLGAARTFLAETSVSMLHAQTAYQNSETASDVERFVKTMRLDYQADYASHRLDAEPIGRFSMPQQLQWSQHLASFSLLGALIVPAAHFLYSLSEGALAVPFPSTHAVLMGLTISLAILSMAAYTYRNGMSLPNEIDSYRVYQRSISSIRARYGASDDAGYRYQLLAELEVAAEEELRRFLEIKGNATFVL